MLINKNEQEQILLAQNSNDINILKELSDSIYISVRRSVSKNNITDKETMEKLCYDPSLNVSYVANKFCKYIDIKREIFSNELCVICEVNESDYITKCYKCKS